MSRLWQVFFISLIAIAPVTASAKVKAKVGACGCNTGCQDIWGDPFGDAPVTPTPRCRTNWDGRNPWWLGSDLPFSVTGTDVVLYGFFHSERQDHAVLNRAALFHAFYINGEWVDRDVFVLGDEADISINARSSCRSHVPVYLKGCHAYDAEHVADDYFEDNFVFIARDFWNSRTNKPGNVSCDIWQEWVQSHRWVDSMADYFPHWYN